MSTEKVSHQRKFYPDNRHVSFSLIPGKVLQLGVIEQLQRLKKKKKKNQVAVHTVLLFILICWHFLQFYTLILL